MKRILLSLFLVTAFSALAMETEEENVLPDITINENNSEPAADGKKVEKLVKRINKLWEEFREIQWGPGVSQHQIINDPPYKRHTY